MLHVVLLLVLVVASTQSTVFIQHRTDKSEFVPRSSLDITSSHVTKNQAPVLLSMSTRNAQVVNVPADQNYYVRLIHGNRVIEKRIPAALLCDHYNDTIVLHVTYTGNLFHFNYVPYNIDTCTKSQKTRQINPTTLFDFAKLSPPTTILPPFIVDAKKPVRSARAEAKVQEEENKSFIQKYWIYIVPVLLYLFLGTTQADKKPEETTGGAAVTRGSGAESTSRGQGRRS